MKLIASIILALVATSTCASKTSFLPKKRSAPSALAIRGGAILDKDAVARSASVVAGVYGGLGALSPAKMAEAYGMGFSPVTIFIGERAATAIYTGTILWWALAQKGASLNTAVGISILPWILLSLHSILNDKPKEMGFPVNVEYLQLAINSCVAHATLTNAEYADSATKGIALWGLLNSMLLFFNPVLFGKVYGTAERDDSVYFARRNYGNNLGSLSVLIGSLALGKDTTTSMGYSWLSNLLGLATMMFITKDIEKQNIEKAPCYAWLVFMSFVVYVLLS